jgi:hypothetical protein
MTSGFRLDGLAIRGFLAASLIFAFACSDNETPTTAPTDESAFARGGVQGPDLRAAIAAKDKHQDRLLAKLGIEGLGVTVTSAGKPAVVVFTRHGSVGGIPDQLDGVPVVRQITGRIEAILPKARPGGGGGRVDPTGRFNRPVPIGVSTGNGGECSAGTIGARVNNGAYALSNNHVYALENTAPTGSLILQPGRYDTNCSLNTADGIGTFSGRYVQITFSTSANNVVDAALASLDNGAVSDATPSNGYGRPNHITRTATVGMSVEKYGRTTGLTHGTVSAINATVNVTYSSGTARFVNQVVFSGKKGAFSKAGDSGSLIVTDDASNNPVALLFAGSNTVTIGNPIASVLSALNITIDGK